MGVIEEIRAGNKETIKAVYKENVKDVYNFAKSITGNHDTALEATKKTFVILFNRIQKGDEPTNIRLAALKIAYDEACAIAMPSTEAIDSPYDKQKNDQETSFKVNSQPAAPSSENNAGVSAAKEVPASKPVKEVKETENRVKKAYPEEDGAYPDKENVFSEKMIITDAEDEDGYDSYEEENEKPKHPVISKILLVINIILVIILIWFVLGLLQNLEIIPENIKMGHEWFNNNIYPLF